MSDILLGPLYLPSLCIFGYWAELFILREKTDCEHRGSDEFWVSEFSFMDCRSVISLFWCIWAQAVVSKTVTGSKGWKKPLHHPSYFRSNGDVYFSGF